MLKDNDRIIFFGDSITQMGLKPNGYITIIKDSLSKNNPSINIIGAGISGNKVPDLQIRVERDVISKSPTIVFIYIGINDVWHSITPGLHGTPKDQYEAGLNEIIRKIKTTSARIILCTPSVIGEKNQGTNKIDGMLDEYAEISRKVANQTRVQLLDLHKDFIDYIASHNPHDDDKGILTIDGVHLNDSGNRFVAVEMLKMLE
ncbi:MAG: GDSL-type esterase/lipase family protein [Ignavibacteriaceae bacterium]